MRLDFVVIRSFHTINLGAIQPVFFMFTPTSASIYLSRNCPVYCLYTRARMCCAQVDRVVTNVTDLKQFSPP